MDFVIEPADSMATRAGAKGVREKVFGKEWGVRLPDISKYDPEDCLTLVARHTQTRETVAALTVVETTTDAVLHRRVSLNLREGSRAARYTQMAVLKPYRGLNLPAQLILKAREEFVLPRGIDYTWLLFDAERAASSSFCTQMGFVAHSDRMWTEYGQSRLLVRCETESLANSHERVPFTAVQPFNPIRETGAAA